MADLDTTELISALNGWKEGLIRTPKLVLAIENYMANVPQEIHITFEPELPRKPIGFIWQ